LIFQRSPPSLGETDTFRNIPFVAGTGRKKGVLNMKNKKLWAGIPVLVFGMAVVGSVFGQDRSLNGKWRSPESKYGGFENDDLCEFTFLAGNYEILSCVGEDRRGRAIVIPLEKGTYTTNDKGVLFLTPTHYYYRETEKWYTKDEFIKFLKSEEGMTDAEIKEGFEEEEIFINRSFVYSISSFLGMHELALYRDGEKSTYIKQ